MASCFSFSATNNPGKGVPARLRKNDDRHGTSYLTPEKTFSILCNTEKPKMATGQTEKFSVHSKHHRAACSDKNGRKKSSKSFSRLTASGAAVGRRLFSCHSPEANL
ncbi:hypothetical protein [Anaerotruncus rubiinfantis]|uniref:hypothetical protein n=1 Tax=Anaerotruncus rubiinfantis TaxID=1720200 RepID=UPI0015A5284B|nr:hypothetical protein [uncultured Dysosmobacter sp.]